MEIITIDGMVEHDFRHSIEDMLRLDQVDEAIARLRGLLKSCAGHGGVLPARFLKVSCEDLIIVGWHRLADRLRDHDRPSRPISAIGVTLADPRTLGGSRATGGWLSPFLKTFYFSDDAYPFSDASRDDLLDGYSREGFEWQGDYQATDATLSIKGIDDLYGALIALEDRLFDNPNPPADEIRAGTIGACYLATLIHQSLRETIRMKGLPRPLCILAACDGVYPFFDAPVAGNDEYQVKRAIETTSHEAIPEEGADLSLEDEDELAEEDLPRAASLLSLISRKGIKAPVMVLAEEDAHEAARFTEMASAQQLGVDADFAPMELLGDNHGPGPVDAVAVGEAQAWGGSGGFDDCPESEDFPAIVAPWRFTPSHGLDGPGTEVLDPSDENDCGVGDSGHSARLSDWFEAVPEDPDAPDTSMANVPVAVPASHSLRARINRDEPGPSRERRSRIGAIVDWFRRLARFR